MDTVTYSLCKKYVEKTAIGLGAVKGAPCTIKNIQESPDGLAEIVTFEWVSTVNPLVKETAQMTVKNGTIVSVIPNITEGTKIADIVIDGVTQSLYVPAGGGGADLTSDLNITRTVGGISSGDHYNNGTSLETILRDMLNPTDFPTLTNPSASLSATGSKLLEKGSTLNTTMTASFNRGSINPAYGTSGYRAGSAISYSLNGGTAQSGTSFNVTVDENLLEYKVTVTYNGGEQPKDSTGNNYSTPLPAGSVDSNIIKYEFVNALWANTANQATIAKVDLVSKNAKQIIFNFPACSSATPETFDVPASWTVTGVEVKNDLTGSWDDCILEFAQTNVTHSDAAGSDVPYTRYYCNLGYDMGARQIRLKWS